MNAHCKGCVYHHSAGRRHPAPAERKYNDRCCKLGAPVNIGWCKTHAAKQVKDQNKEAV